MLLRAPWFVKEKENLFNCGHCILLNLPEVFKFPSSVSFLISLHLHQVFGAFFLLCPRTRTRSPPSLLLQHINTSFQGLFTPFFHVVTSFQEKEVISHRPHGSPPLYISKNVHKTQEKPSDWSLVCCPNYRPYSLEFSWRFSRKVTANYLDRPGRCYCDSRTQKLIIYDIDHTCPGSLTLEAILDGSEVFGEFSYKVKWFLNQHWKLHKHLLFTNHLQVIVTLFSAFLFQDLTYLTIVLTRSEGTHDTGLN